MNSNGEIKDSVKYVDDKGPEVYDGRNDPYTNTTKEEDVEKTHERPYN